MTGNQFEEYTDEFGQVAPLPAGDGQRMPPAPDFQFGPAVGEAFPDITLREANGARMNLHQDRNGAKAAVLFYRSAVW